MFDGILFDLDGTLWDATRGIADAWNALIACTPELSRPPVDAAEAASVMGQPLDVITRRIFPMVPEERVEEIAALLSEHDTAYLLSHGGGQVYPGVEETLAALARTARLFVVSNCQAGYIECFFETSGLGRYFTDHLCPGDTGRLKADNIAQIVREHGLVSPVYVGDTELDFLSASTAGVPFLHARYGFGSVDASLSAVSSFPELPAALARMSPP